MVVKRLDKPVRRTRGANLDLTFWQRENLLHEVEMDLLGEGPPETEIWPGGESQKKRAWKKHGAHLLKEYVLDYPGRRPPSFWKWTSTEKKRLLGFGSWFDDRRIFKIYPIHETDCQFLKRLNLVLPAENGHIERSSSFDQETQTRLLAAHETHLKFVPRDEVAAAEKAAGLTSSRLKVVA